MQERYIPEPNESSLVPLDLIQAVYGAVQLSNSQRVNRPQRSARQPDRERIGLLPPHQPVDIQAEMLRETLPTDALQRQLEEVAANSITEQARGK